MWDIIDKHAKLIETFMICFMVTILAVSLASHKKKIEAIPQTVSIDTNSIVAEFIQINKGKSISEIELNIMVDKFSANLGKIIEERASTEHLVILPKQAIIAGGKDYTNIIKTDVLKGL